MLAKPVNLRRFLLANASLITIAAMQPRLTAKTLADILARAYAGLGLAHLDDAARGK